MAIFDLTITPTRSATQLIANTGVFGGSLTGSAQTRDRQGLKWQHSLVYNNVTGDNRAQLMGLIVSLRGQANRLRVPIFDNPNRGSYGGTPLVAGASQTGNSLTVDGCSNNITNWIRYGDYFSVIVNGEPELKMCMADASSNGSGQITITFEPKLRASPADNAVIYVEDGVLSTPKGIFLQTGPEAGWSSTTWTNGELSTFNLELIEDIFGTQ